MCTGGDRRAPARLGAPLALVTLLVTCAWTTPRLPQRVEPWPEADALFHGDPHWLGADGAWTIDLGGGRVLWLFGDTFIDTSGARLRSRSVMVRNSIAIQEGSDPATATIRFFWRGAGGIGGGDRPESFFPENGARWYWPGHGARIGKSLLLFLLEEHAVPHDLGFEAVGTTAIVIDNPDDAPSMWIQRRLPLPANDFGAKVGAGAVMADRGYLYAYSPVEPGNHDVYLARWPIGRIRKGDLSSPAWWSGTWAAPVPEKRRIPIPVFTGGQTEFTVHHDARRKLYVEVQTVGFGASEVALRTAAAPEGPWPSPAPIYRPPESSRPRAMVYAGKAHPALTGADLVITYASNSLDFATIVVDTSYYYPRFVRAHW